MSTPLSPFHNRDNIPAFGISVFPEHRREESRSLSEIRNQHDPRRFDVFVPSSVPPCRYPPIVKENPESWPCSWQGVWKGDDNHG